MNNIPSNFPEIKFTAQFNFFAVFAYCDTLEYFVRRLPRTKIRAEWETALGRPVIFNLCKDRNGNLCGYRVIAHQPSQRNLMVLDQLQQRFNAVLYRFDLAIDWTFASETEKQRWREWLEKTVLLRWRRNGPMHEERDDYGETTLYWTKTKNRKRTSRNLKLYDGRTSKVSGAEHCVHLELSFFRAASCRAQGIQRASDVLKLDPRKLFNKHVKLVDGVDAYVSKRIRAEVKADRERHLAAKHKSEHSDKSRLTTRLLHYRLQRTGKMRAQTVKGFAPRWLKNSISIDTLKIPSRITSAQLDTLFLKNSMISIPATSTPTPSRLTPSFDHLHVD